MKTGRQSESFSKGKPWEGDPRTESIVENIRRGSSRQYKMLTAFAILVFITPLWANAIPGQVIHIDITNLMILAGIYACVVIGLTLLVGYAGQISLGHAAFFGIGAYTTAFLTTRVSWIPPWLGVVAGIILAALVGYLVGKPVLRLKGDYLAMATLGLGLIFFIIFRELRAVTGGNTGISGIPDFSLFGLQFDTDLKLFFLVWFIVFLLMIFSLNLVRSRVGRGLRALKSSDVAADAMGVDTAREKVKIFVLSAAFAGLGGGLLAHFQKYIDPQYFTFTISILFITMVVVGGMDSVWGALVGVIILTFLPHIIQTLPRWVPALPASMKNFTNYQLMLYGVLLIIFMIFMPKGIVYGIALGMNNIEKRAKRVRDRLRARKYE